MKNLINKTYSSYEVESKLYNYWLKNNFFSSKIDKTKSNYTLLMPPPNVTGILHMGHVLNNTIQDVLVRRARQLGLNACWVPGIDHASIATEAKVVDKLKKDGILKSQISREKFLKHAWDWKEKHGNIILNQLKRLGASCDWDRVKFTMDDDMSESVINVFIELFEKGLIYRGVRMVNWDPMAKTAISDEEVIYKEQNSNLYYIKYKLKDYEGEITIATTRPETILGDTAICVNPKDKRYTSLIGKKALVPLLNREIPIISDNYIDPEFGTGALKVTPAHDINDYKIGKKNNLEIISVIDNHGLINEQGKLYVGKDRFEVRKQIIKDIKSIDQLEKIETIKNKVGFSERTNVVIEPKLSMQWFCNVKEISKPALDAVLKSKINFYPKNFKNIYKHWMENIQDWCISRQLWWGHRIPVFYYNNDEFVVAKNKNEALIKIKKINGFKDIKLSEIKQDEDVLDTWFSSWLWPISVFDGINKKNNSELEYYFPTNDLVTGPDIIFFWVARMIMAGFTFTKSIPFKNVYFTGIVRDKKRRKMSKSLGNSPDAIELIDKYGADGVRSGMLFSSNAGNDLLFDESLCEQGRNFSNKIWNAFRLIKSWKVSSNNQSELNRVTVNWFDSKLSESLKSINDSFEKFRISECLMKTYKLIWDDFCSYYLELIKPHNQEIDIKTKEQTVHFLEKLMIILHPFMPFITEEVWRKIITRENTESIVFASWPDVKKSNKKLLSSFSYLFKLISKIRKIKKDKGLPPKKSIELYYEGTLEKSQIEVLKKMCFISKIELVNEKVEGSFPFLLETNRYYLILPLIINKEEEKIRLQKELDYQVSFLSSVEKKLSNKNFINNAPEKVLNLERKKQKDAIMKIDSIKNQITLL